MPHLDRTALQGRRIAITRQPKDGEGLAALLRGLGAEVTFFPSIERRPPSSWDPLDRGLRELAEGGYDGLLLTSPAAVQAVAHRREALGLGWARTFVGAVGPGTGRAAEREGWAPQVIPSRHDGVALAAAVAEAYGAALRGQRFLQPRAEEGREELARHLTARGATVDVVPAYRTVPAPAEALRPLSLAARAGTVEAVVFASPSAVEAVFAASSESSSWLGDAWAVAIGDTTAAALRRRGVERVRAATQATDEGLLEATLRAMAAG